MKLEIITAELDTEPRNFWEVGQEWKQKNGTRIGSGVREYTYWTSLHKQGEDSELLTILDADLIWLEQKRDFLNRFVVTGGWITYYVSWFASERSGGLSISPSLLKRLGNLHISLSLDVYSYRGEEEMSSSSTQCVGVDNASAKDESDPSETEQTKTPAN